MELNEDFALLYGILLGDGSISKIKRKDRENGFYHFINITCNYYDDQPFIFNIVLPILKRVVGREIKTIKYRKDGAVRIQFCCKELFNRLTELDFPIGVKANNSFISNIFYEKNLVKQLIQGFMATDGYLLINPNRNYYYPRLGAKVTSIRLLKQIFEYLVNLGLNGHFHNVNINTKGSISKKPQSRIEFNGLINLNSFHEKIGFVNPKHENMYLNFVEYYGLTRLDNGLYRKSWDFKKMALPGFEPGITSV